MKEESTLLVIDDDEDTRILIEAVLNSLGHQVILAESGEKGIEELDSEEKSSRFDAIFLDLMMPGISGFGVIEALKAMDHARDIPVVMLTAKDSANDMITGYKFGADYYITKPFTREQITFGLNIIFDDEKSELDKLSEK
ncbi:MAG: response regulator [Bdellovibrionales bacterium]|nr:response regulator [Bdellovibrionales bacterium]